MYPVILPVAVRLHLTLQIADDLLLYAYIHLQKAILHRQGVDLLLVVLFLVVPSFDIFLAGDIMTLH